MEKNYSRIDGQTEKFNSLKTRMREQMENLYSWIEKKYSRTDRDWMTEKFGVSDEIKLNRQVAKYGLSLISNLTDLANFGFATKF